MDDADAAVETVRSTTPFLPYWPQLPRRSPRETMLRQLFASAFTDLSAMPIDAGFSMAREEIIERLRRPHCIDERSHAGYRVFVQALQKGAFQDAHAVKGQVTGPLTAGLYARSAEGDWLRHEPELMEALCGQIVSYAAAQVQELGRAGKPVIVQVDEPALSQVDDDHVPLLVEVLDRIRDLGAVTMLHTCGPIDENGIFFAGGADILSFDVYTTEPSRDILGPLRRQLLRGGRVAWGVAPSVAQYGVGEEDDWLATVVAWWRGIDLPRELQDLSLLTPTCGFGGAEDSRQVLDAFRFARRCGAILSSGEF